MHRARRRQEWYHTAALLATLANANRDPKKTPDPYLDSEFHPEGKAVYAEPAKRPVDTTDLSILRRATEGEYDARTIRLLSR